MKCNFCGTEIIDTSKFCKECGKTVVNMPGICRFCGAKLELDAKFCSECGNSLVPSPSVKNKPTAPEIKDGDEWKYLMSKEYEESVICSECGSACSPEAVKCKKCGAPLTITKKNTHIDDYPLLILNVLSFLIPLLGLVLFLVYKSERPRSAAEYGTSAISGFFFGIVVSVILSILIAIISFSLG